MPKSCHQKAKNYPGENDKTGKACLPINTWAAGINTYRGDD
jgi:hypothetical protein